MEDTEFPKLVHCQQCGGKMESWGAPDTCPCCDGKWGDTPPTNPDTSLWE